MHRYLAVGVLLAVTLLMSSPSGIATQSAGQSTGAMTNEDVLAMVKGGLGDEVIVAAIARAARRAFDTSADALVALKGAGVGDAVLAAMLAPSAPPGLAAGLEAVAFDARRAPGIYLRSDAGPSAAELIPLEPTVITRMEHRGRLRSFFSGGLAKQEAWAIVPGPQANVRSTGTEPTFLFYFGQTAGSSGMQTGAFGGWLSAASSPNEFVLVEMYREADKGQRALPIGKFNSFGSNTGVQAEDVVPVEIQRLEAGSYTVRPSIALTPGEYCFFYAAGVSNLGTGATGKLFDFGVDSDPARASGQR